MHVERVLSLNDGWSILTAQKQAEWEEALLALEVINDDYLLGRINEDDSKSTYIGYVYMSLCQAYNQLLKGDFDWQAQVPGNDINQAHYNSNRIKNGLLASIAGEDDLISFSLPKLLHITIPYYHHEALIDVGVVFVPTNALVQHIIELGAKGDHKERIPTEEFSRAEATRFIALTSRAPVVLAFFSSAPTPPDEIAVEELSQLKLSPTTIDRTIEFAPEYYQAGVGLLSYFGEVLRQKDPDTKAKVRIEQDGRIVRLHIESSTGEIETIEKELDQYALVISEQAPPESLFENQVYIMQLEHRLDVAKLELKQAHNTLALLKDLRNENISNLEQELTSLRNLVAGQLLHGKTFPIANRQASSHEKMHKALITKSGLLFKSLQQDSDEDQQLIEALNTLQQNLPAGIATIEIEGKLEQALSTINSLKPKFLHRIYTELDSAPYKAASGSAIDWVLKWIGQYQ